MGRSEKTMRTKKVSILVMTEPTEEKHTGVYEAKRRKCGLTLVAALVVSASSVVASSYDEVFSVCSGSNLDMSARIATLEVAGWTIKPTAELVVEDFTGIAVYGAALGLAVNATTLSDEYVTSRRDHFSTHMQEPNDYFKSAFLFKETVNGRSEVELLRIGEASDPITLFCYFSTPADSAIEAVEQSLKSQSALQNYGPVQMFFGEKDESTNSHSVTTSYNLVFADRSSVSQELGINFPYDFVATIDTTILDK